MPHPSRPGPMLRRAALAALLLASSAPALAQLPSTAVVQRLPQPDDPGEKLATALRTLAVNPNDLSALIAAGQNALALGDPNAAVGFFGRAGGLAPRDGRVKAGLGSALVQLEKPQEALRQFGEAASLGVPEADFATDRGLAYDLTGATQRAQRDYQVALAAHPEDEATRRRLALSQGIAGDRKSAIATLDPLIRKRDIAAWRAQTFVLAMTGDTQGANDITRIMIPQQQAALQPFLQRLAALSPADKARAVHFGEMPSAGRAYSQTQLANIGAPPTYAQRAPAPAPAEATPPRAAPSVAAPPPAPRPAATSSDLATGAGAGVASGSGAAPLAAAALATSPNPPGAPPVAVASAPPPIAATALPPSQSAGLPIGSTGSEGSFGLPRDAAPRARATQPAARPRIVVAESRAPIAVAPAPEARQVVTPASKPPAPVHDRPRVADFRPVEAAPAAPSAAAAAKPVRLGAADEARARVAPAKSRADTSSVEQDNAVRAAPKERLARRDDEQDTSADAARSATTRPGRGTADETGRKSARDHDDASGKTRASSRKGARDDADGAGSASPRVKAGSAARGGRAQPDEDEAVRSSTRAKGSSAARDARGKGDTDGSGAGSAHSKAKGGAAAKEKSAPARVYVQVAGGANRDDLGKAWSGLKKKAPDLMKGHAPATTPIHATNRLMVGPFKDEAEAQAFVNKASAKGVSSFVVKTDKGQKVDKIDVGQ